MGIGPGERVGTLEFPVLYPANGRNVFATKPTTVRPSQSGPTRPNRPVSCLKQIAMPLAQFPALIQTFPREPTPVIGVTSLFTPVWRLPMPKLLAIAAVLLVAGAPLVSFAQSSAKPNPAATPETSTAPGKLTNQEIKNRLESLGYTQVKNISPTPRGTSAKAMKGDKPVTVVVDSAGKIIDER